MYSIIFFTNGEVKTKYKHPGTVYCCDWNPGNKWVALSVLFDFDKLYGKCKCVLFAFMYFLEIWLQQVVKTKMFGFTI